MSHFDHDLITLTLVKTLLLADADHCPAIRTITGALKRYLIHNGSSINQPSDSTNICPTQSRVVEDAGIFRLAFVKFIDELISVNTHGLSGAVQVQPVTGLILHFCQ